jgi:hypothetical protein
MSSTAKTFAAFFAILAFAALGHDIYVWQTSDGFPFAFAALGWITKTYALEYHQIVVDVLGAEAFNTILTPILRIPAFFLAVGLTVFSSVIGFILHKVKSARTPPPRKRPQIK